MKKHSAFALWLIAIIVLAACGTNEQPTEIALAGPRVPTRVPTQTLTPTDTSTPTDTPTPTDIATETPTETATASETPTETATLTETPTDTPTETATPTATLTDAPTETPSVTPSAIPTEIPLPTSTPGTSTGGMLGPGETVTGQISSGAYEVLYTFDGTAGEVVSIEMVAQSGDLDTYLALLDPSNTEIASNDDRESDTNSRIGFVTLPQTGTYTIVATRFSRERGSTQGSFTLQLINEGGAVVVGDGTIEFGQRVAGRIDNTTSSNDYSFQANTGDVITITLSATSGDLDPLLELYDGAGSQVVFNDDDPLDNTLNSAIREFSIPQGGTYTIRATRFERESGSTTGNFDLELILVSGVSRETTDPFTPIPIGLNETVSGWIFSDHHLQLYSFEGRAFQEITVQMNQTSNNLLPVLILLDPESRPIARYDGVNGDGLSATLDNVDLPVTGTYTIVASRTESNIGITSGGYDLTVTESAGETQIASLFLDLNYDTTVTGQLSPDNFENHYRFYAAEGDVITATMRAAGDDLDTLLVLQDAYGQEVARNDDNVFDDNVSNSEIFLALLDDEGYYFLVASAFDPSAITQGQYELIFELAEQLAASPYRAVLDPFASHGIMENGSTLLYLAAGDWTDTEGSDFRVSSLITYQLPELEDDDELTEALLDLSDCYTTIDDVFGMFGELTVYLNGTYNSNLNVIENATYQDEVGRISECGVLDITDYVQDTYDAGMTIIQFYLEFDSFQVIENGEIDTVIFASPVLDVYADD